MFPFEVGTPLRDCVLVTLAVIQLSTSRLVYGADNKVFTYHICTNMSTWREADSYCRALWPSSHLAILDNKDKLSRATGFLFDNNHSSLWIGGHQNESDSYWMWLNGKSLDEPSGNGNCLALVNNMTWAIPCQTRSRYYACSFNASSCLKTGEILYNGTMECIKLFNIADTETNQTWNETRGSCLNKTGSLASLSGINISHAANITHVGGQRYHRWWWAYNSESGIKTLSLSVNKTKPRGQCLVITNDHVMIVNCSEQHYVLCEEIRSPTSMNWKLFLIIGIMTGMFILLIAVITYLVRRVRRQRNNEASSHSCNQQIQQTDVIYSEAMTAYPELEAELSLQTTNRKTKPKRQPLASPYAMARIESIIDRAQQENRRDSTETGTRRSENQASKTEEHLSPSGTDGTNTVTSREPWNPQSVPCQ